MTSNHRLHSYLCDVPTRAPIPKPTPLRHTLVNPPLLTPPPKKGFGVFLFLSGFVCILFCYYNHSRGKSNELGVQRGQKVPKIVTGIGPLVHRSLTKLFLQASNNIFHMVGLKYTNTPSKNLLT